MKIIIFFFSALFMTCNQVEEKHIMKNNNKITKQSKIYIPKSLKPLETGTEPLRFGNLFKLEDITNGYDSLCFRVWFWDRDTSYMVNIENDGSSNISRIISFKVIENNSADSSWIYVLKDTNIANVSIGWQGFFDILNKNNYEALHDGDSLIEGKHSFTGGTFYQFEIATKDKYHNYGYTEPYVYEDEIPQAKNVVSILDLINQQFFLPPLKKWK